MPLRIIRNDITKVKADAIVNAANPNPIIGSGTDSAIYKAAGEKELLADRKKIGKIEVGTCAYTKGYKLKAKYIIHAAGPYWIDGKHDEEKLLKQCYANCLNLAKDLKCKSIAFPFISTGVYRFPKTKALNIATSTINEFLLENDMNVMLVVFDNESFRLSGKLYENVDSYIDDHYIENYHDSEYYNDVRSERIRRERMMNIPPTGGFANPEDHSPFDIKKQRFNVDNTFQEKLLRYIDSSGMKDPEVYKAMGMTKQNFSKIVSNKNYQPKKDTAMLFCIILKLDYEKSDDLLSSAGYSFSPSSRRDLAIECFIKNNIYDLIEIDNFLVSQNYPQLYKS